MVGGARMGTFVKVMLGVVGILAVATVLVLLGVCVGVTNHQIESEIHGVQPRVSEEIQRNFEGLDEAWWKLVGTISLLVASFMAAPRVFSWFLKWYYRPRKVVVMRPR